LRAARAGAGKFDRVHDASDAQARAMPKRTWRRLRLCAWDDARHAMRGYGIKSVAQGFHRHQPEWYKVASTKVTPARDGMRASLDGV
jgi:hypothetical protein